MRQLFFVIVCAAIFMGMLVPGIAEEAKPAPAAEPEYTLEKFKDELTARTADFEDLSATTVVTYKNKKALSKIEGSYSSMYEFKSARVYAKYPDKMKTEGKLGMVSFSYTINGNFRYVRAPSIRMNRTDDFSDRQAKLDDFSTLGLLAPDLWRLKELTLLQDDEAKANGEILLNGSYPGNSTLNLYWVDAENYYLKRFEKRREDGKVVVIRKYINHKLFANAMWVPTAVEIYTPNEERAGVFEMRDIKVNTGLSDDLFK